mmetsp:Transcript_104544/g.326016  ORF Transcript_104544/g.326016 Transcript_104544/m.326016 type:complete len:536 (+) Transcript_104544:3-1610(+)
MDADKSGYVSKLELVDAVRKHRRVADFVLPHVNCNQALGDEAVFDAVSSIFEAIAGGKRRFDFADFERYFGKVACTEPRPRAPINRAAVKIFIIGPGFGLQLNPRQGASIVQAGFQVRWCHDVPNPEQPNFPVLPYLEQIKAQMDEFQPDVVAAASKGGAYVTGLWRVGYWRGATLLLNAHPTCNQIPGGVNLVLAHGSNDEVYSVPRADLEALVSQGEENRCFLYYTANSGQLPSGQLSRLGDRHNMESLLQHDLLPRLIDSLLSPEGPEVHMVRTWRDRLSEERLESECWLGYTPERLRRHWSSHHRKGLDDCKLFDVPFNSEEFHRVAAIFRAAPREPPAYMLSPQAVWDRVRIVRLQRVENGLQVDGSTNPYHASMRRFGGAGRRLRARRPHQLDVPRRGRQRPRVHREQPRGGVPAPRVRHARGFALGPRHLLRARGQVRGGWRLLRAARRRRHAPDADVPLLDGDPLPGGPAAQGRAPLPQEAAPVPLLRGQPVQPRDLHRAARRRGAARVRHHLRLSVSSCGRGRAER